jgi:hypothetical protein
MLLIHNEPGNLTTSLRGGWTIEFIESEEGADVIIRNPLNPSDYSAGEKFYQVTTVGNGRGAPILVQEPTLGIDAHRAGIDLDANIVGFVIVEDGRVVERASLSNIVYMEGGTVDVNLAGELIVNDEPRGFIQMLVAPDKNRLVGYVAYVGPDKPDVVAIEELETLALRLLS